MDPQFKIAMVTERTRLEWQDIFANEFGIGKGLAQYETGKRLLYEAGLDCEQARKELAHWCEV